MAVAAGIYPTETEACPRCDGTGRIEWDDRSDPNFQAAFARCAHCAGVGTITVCAECHDNGEHCGACGA